MRELKHRVGEVGVKFRPTFVDQSGSVVNLSTTTLAEIRLRGPAGVTKVLDAAFPAGQDGTQGTIEAPTIAGTIDEPGLWHWQGHAVGPTFEVWTQLSLFEAEANL